MNMSGGLNCSKIVILFPFCYLNKFLFYNYIIYSSIMEFYFKDSIIPLRKKELILYLIKSKLDEWKYKYCQVLVFENK